jgi:hypothetical protein
MDLGRSIVKRTFRTLGLLLWIVAAGSGRVLASEAPASTNQTTLSAYGYDGDVFPLLRGPHLFMDWRYVSDGKAVWVGPDQKPMEVKTKRQKEIPEAERAEAERQIGWGDGRLPWGIRIEAQQAEKVGPILSADQPWENRFAFPSLLKIGDKYVLYYEVEPPPGHPEVANKILCLAESTNGKEWTKTHLGLVEFGGNKDNNIVYGGTLCRYGFTGHCVFMDPVAPPAERYKMVYQADVPVDVIKSPEQGGPLQGVGRDKGEVLQALMSAVSPDGIHWKENPRPLLAPIRDAQNTVYYDEVLKRYVSFMRYKVLTRRAIGRSETADFNNWPGPRPILWPGPQDEPSDDYYVNGKSRYPGAPGEHMLFTSVYKGATDSTTLRLAASPDGTLWNWVPGGDLMTPGPDGSWDGGYFFAGGGTMVELPDDRVAIPFLTSRLPHKFPRFMRQGAAGLATWPKERIAALVADNEAEFYSPVMSATGSELYLNFQTRRAGYIKVEVVDAKGRALADCDPLVGDHLKAKVAWKGESKLDPATLKQFQLHFRMRAARIYSFEVRP